MFERKIKEKTTPGAMPKITVVSAMAKGTDSGAMASLFSNAGTGQTRIYYEDLNKRVPEYKKFWDKNGVVQYKDSYCAILQRGYVAQVEFIIAYSDLTKEGYRLVAQDEGKSAGNGGTSSYYYFQNMKYVSSLKST